MNGAASSGACLNTNTINTERGTIAEMTSISVDTNLQDDSDASLHEVTSTYNRIAPLYDLLDAVYERSWKSKLRGELFAQASGRILDVGVGTGCNMPFYPKNTEVVGIDASRSMLVRARKRAQKLHANVTLQEMNLLELNFEDGSFDTLVATFVLLCLPQELQRPALAELGRVCAPDGRILLLDYRQSNKKGTQIWMRCVQPWLKWAFAASYNAGTEHHVDEAGLEIVERKLLMGDGVILLVLRPKQQKTAAT